MSHIAVPPKPWLTPTPQQKRASAYNHLTDSPTKPSPDDLGGYGSPLKSGTGRRDERFPAEKFVDLAQELFEAEDSLPNDLTSPDDLPSEFFSHNTETSDLDKPLIAPERIKKLLKHINGTKTTGRRYGIAGNSLMTPGLATPSSNAAAKGRISRMNQVDSQTLARLLRMLGRSVKIGELVDPFSIGSGPAGSLENASPKKKKKPKDKQVAENGMAENGDGNGDVDMDLGPPKLSKKGKEISAVDAEMCTRALEIARESIIAAEAVLGLLVSDRLGKQVCPTPSFSCWC
jgi:cohesin loading factor subunit SCC2